MKKLVKSKKHAKLFTKPKSVNPFNASLNNKHRLTAAHPTFKPQPVRTCYPFLFRNRLTTFSSANASSISHAEMAAITQNKTSKIFKPFRLNDSELSVRPLTETELGQHGSQWFPDINTPNSIAAVYHSDPHGWYGVVNAKDQPVGAIGALTKSQRSAWLSYFYLEPQYRGQAIGSELMNQVIKQHRHAGINQLSLQCLPDLESMYQSYYGFKTLYYDEIRSESVKITPPTQNTISPKPLDKDNYLKILNYDSDVQYGFKRHPFLWNWLSKPNTETLVIIDVGSVVGYSVVSPFYFRTKDYGNHHIRIAPLYANNAENAKKLLQASYEHAAIKLKHTLSASAQPPEEAMVILDVEGGNPTAAALLKECGLFQNTQTKLARMMLTADEDVNPYYAQSQVYTPTDYGSGP